MAIERRPLHPLFGLKLVGLDIAKPLNEETVAAVRKAIGDGGVVVIPNNADTSEDDLIRFASSLGPLHKLPLPKDAVGDVQYTVRLTNLDRDGNIIPTTERVQRMSLSNQLWHTDSTFIKPRSSVSFLLGLTIPPAGGDTHYCDTRVAYETLPDATRARIDQMTAYHSIVHSRNLIGVTDSTPEERSRPPIRRPLVHVHEPSGRTAICLASHVCAIDGLSGPEAQALVDELMAHATTPERTYVHRWRKGDIVIWDNRCTMHRARPYDFERHGREVRSVRIVDTTDA